MGSVPLDIWEQHYADGQAFHPLGDAERALLAEHAPAPEVGGRALEVGCGTGELAAHLTAAGYSVDALDLATAALERARTEHDDVTAVRWMRLDIELDDPAELDDDGYDLVTLRLAVAFLHDRTRVLHTLGERLRPGGAVVVITPTATDTPAERRGIALDEGELALLGTGWETAQRLEADGPAVLVLQGPCHARTVAVERRCPPAGPAATAALAVVTDRAGRVLLGYSRRGMWELPGGKPIGADLFLRRVARPARPRLSRPGLRSGRARPERRLARRHPRSSGRPVLPPRRRPAARTR
ncbi:class I SAM-dependent methyltransferase [Kitasatospora sp. NBC_01560]|uniref:class I SAM-dependent methyltransferase n=1 Tax=Kitasatospora sp. NBC_01560 TaxID=2975965 RepID=UPI003868ED72